jgi:hypothetical protein
MNEVMNVDEVEKPYSPDWVLIEDRQIDEMQRLKSGKVVFHSPDRTAVWNKARELNLDHVAVRYLGPRFPRVRPCGGSHAPIDSWNSTSRSCRGAADPRGASRCCVVSRDKMGGWKP